MILAPRWALRALDPAAKRRVVKDLGEIFSAQEILLIRRVWRGSEVRNKKRHPVLRLVIA
ncbi:hypothetical protein [Propionivibrio sp.]|uniref:hypothetical protein n=1 Tax=Propionivibrio sp. TaxID=2212460 RepID=UPI0025EB84F4|nr:hypothetical protein [Propionivibrio sp.]MBK7356360.1 hypothetical protein [Propionivibrio sp.]